MPVPGPLLKGLLPGRGPVGRPIPVPVPKGLLPGRGPAGRVAGRGADASAADTSAAGASAEGAGAGSGSTGAGLTGGATAAASAGAATAASTGLTTAPSSAAAFLAAGLRLGAACSAAGGMASRSRRATGASTVDDADFTNSPMSCSLARTSLLVTPSSLASSWTRTFDTTLLSWSGQGAPDRQCMRYTFMLARSWGVHPRTPGPLDRRPSPVPFVPGGRRERPCQTDVHCLPQRADIQLPDHPQCAGQGLGTLSTIQTLLGRVHVRTASGQSPRWIRDHPALHGHHPDEGGSVGPLAAPDAHALGACRTDRLRVYSFAHGGQSTAAMDPGGDSTVDSPAGADCPPVGVSGRISMRQPVRRAASRAFCPSRPIARDNW